MVTFRYKIGKLFYQNILWYHKNYVTLHQKSETLSHMNTKKDHQQQVTPSQEEVFREKTHNYLVCFIESCPLKEQCLRWLVGQYADTMPFAQKSINPRNPQIGGEQCVKFRPNTRVCKTPYDYYRSPTITFIEAVVSGNNLTLRKSEPDEYTSKITVNSVSFYPTSLEYGKPVEVTVNLTNNGDSYQELVYLSLGSQKTVVCGSVEAGQTGNVKLHLTPAQVGTMTLKISTDYYASNEVWSEQVTVEAAKPQLLSAMATTPGLVNNVLTGTTLKVNAVVKNDGSNTYENGIELLLCKITWEDPKTGSYGYSYDKTKSVMTTILPGETKEVNFEVKDLDLDGKYFYSIWYYSENMGVELIPAETSFILKEEPVDPEEPEDTPISGDADGNGKVEAADIDAVVKYIMEGDFEGFNFKNADLNGDDKVDAADLVLLINMVKP